MKRFAAVAILLLLILSGCGLKGSEASDGVSGEISDGVSEEESAEISFPPIPVPEHPRILIITPIWLNETEYVEPDYNLSLETAYDYDADLMGTFKTIELEGVRFTGKYSYTLATAGDLPGRYLGYIGPSQAFYFAYDNEKQGLLKFFVIPDLLPEEMREKWMSSDTMPDIEELKEKSLRFMETYCALDVSEWEEQVDLRQEPYYSDIIGEYIDGFELAFRRYKNDICTSGISFDYDLYGNLMSYSSTNLYYWEGVNIPDWPDEVYVEATLERLRDIYSADEHVVDIKAQDPPFREKALAYVQPFDVYAISYTMYYTVIYDDGTERNDAHSFKFVIPEWE